MSSIFLRVLSSFGFAVPSGILSIFLSTSVVKLVKLGMLSSHILLGETRLVQFLHLQECLDAIILIKGDFMSCLLTKFNRHCLQSLIIHVFPRRHLTWYKAQGWIIPGLPFLRFGMPWAFRGKLVNFCAQRCM